MRARPELIAGQAALLRRHRRGLVRVARLLAARSRRDTTEIIFLLAHQDSRVGRLAREQLGGWVIGGKAAVVVPGVAKDLPRWLERLALAGPVVDCTAGGRGVAVIVIDEDDAMALCRVPLVTAAAAITTWNRTEIPLG